MQPITVARSVFAHDLGGIAQIKSPGLIVLDAGASLYIEAHHKLGERLKRRSRICPRPLVVDRFLGLHLGKKKMARLHFRQLVLAGLFILGLTTGGFAQPTKTPANKDELSADEQQIRQSVVAFVEQYNAHQADKLAALKHVVSPDSRATPESQLQGAMQRIPVADQDSATRPATASSMLHGLFGMF